MMVYGWSNQRYLDLLEIALDLTRDEYSPPEVLHWLIVYCNETESFDVPIADLSKMVASIQEFTPSPRGRDIAC